MANRPGPAAFPWTQTTIMIVGGLLFLWGLTGFFFLGDASTALTGRDTGQGPLGLTTNGLQNVLHILVGMGALVSATSGRAARAAGFGLIAVGAALVVFGVLGAVRPELNIFSLNIAGTIAHGLLAVVGLVLVLGRVRIPPGQETGPFHETGSS